MAESDPFHVPGADPSDDEARQRAERDSQRAKRDSLFLMTVIARANGESLGQARVRNLSATGLMADCDRALVEGDRVLIELRTRDRQRKLISKIDAALRRIDEGEYGYCEVTGEPISLGRLEARPIATMTVEAQERHERQEKVSRDD